MVDRNRRLGISALILFGAPPPPSPIAGRMMSGCPISRTVSYARRADAGVPTSGRRSARADGHRSPVTDKRPQRETQCCTKAANPVGGFLPVGAGQLNREL